jgi:cell shape-determining protein MreC
MNFTDIELLRHQIVAMAIQMRTMKSEVSEIVGRLTDYTSRLECNIRRLAERVEQLEQLNTEGNSSPSEDTALDRSLQTNSRKDRKTSKVLP